MKHGAQCELKQTQFTPWGIRTPSCQCGSRAFPLCSGCASDQHLKHHPKAMTGDRGVVILLYPCTDCPNGLTEQRNSSCVRCKAKFEAEFNPNDRPTVTPRPGRWARVWRWLETRPDWIADLGSED